MLIKKKKCPFCEKQVTTIGIDDVEELKKYITEKGKIIGSRFTGVCSWHQRKLKKAIKLARNAGLLSFISK
ncbi:MAG: 30S ribosomal protein S18 [candidate division WOR-3 bacterium]